jgi:hypothetical protein
MKKTIYLALVVLAVASCSRQRTPTQEKAYLEYLRGLYDADVTLEDALYRYDSPRAFNGDGYSIAVHELPPEIRSRFEASDERLLSQFPMRPDYRHKWETQHWQAGPITSDFKNHIDFALMGSKGDPGLPGAFHAVREALAREQTFYAFFFKTPGGLLQNIDLFVVDLKGGRLYVINQNM